MTSFPQPLSASPRVTAAYLAVLRLGRARGYSITRTKIAKLLYLADLAAVQAGDDPISGVEWQWLNHGPFSNDLQRLENDLVRFGAISREQYYSGWEIRLVDEITGYDMDPEDMEILEAAVAQFGNLAAASLRDLSYQTPPMVEAQKFHRGVFLDLSLARPRPRLEGLAQRMSEVIRRLPEQETDPGVFLDIDQETAGLDRYRREVNEAVLTDDQ